VDGFAWIPANHRFVERTKERCTPGAQAIENRGFSSAIRAYPCAWPELIGGQQQREMVREEQGDTAVVVAERFNPDPDDFSRCCEAVEICRIVPVDSCRQNLCLENRCRQRHSLQLLDSVDECVGAAAPFDNSLPG